MISDAHQWMIIVAYGPIDKFDLPSSVSELEQVGNSKSTMVRGWDFKQVLYSIERNREGWRFGGMELFGDFVNNYNLLDVPISSTNFTWSNFQEAPTLSKLDRFLLSMSREDLFALLEVIPLARPSSDHIPLVLKRDARIFGPRPFRF